MKGTPRSQKTTGFKQKFESFRDVEKALNDHLRRTDPEFLKRSEHTSQRFAAAREREEQNTEEEPSEP